MINHLITLIVPIFAVIVCDWRPTWFTYRNAVIGFSIYFPVALISNYLTVTGNYFYQTDRPFLHDISGWLFAILSYVVTVLGFLIISVIYSLTRRFIKLPEK